MDTKNITTAPPNAGRDIQEAQLPLREQGVSCMLSSHHNATLKNLAFLSLLICWKLRAGFLPNLHGNGRICKSTNRLSVLSKEPRDYLHKKIYWQKYTMLNTSVVSFYNNFGLIFTGLENMATKGIENWKLSTSPLSTDASSHKNPSNENRF